LTDSRGRTVSFTNTVIILTSNLGAQSLLKLSDESDEKEKSVAHASVMKAVRAHFSPEFLNRLSAIVMFNSLGRSQLEKICHKAMRGVKRRLATQGIRVVLEKSGAQSILEASFDPNYGARPVERYLEQTVVTKLSKMLIAGEIRNGCSVYIEAISSSDDELDYFDVGPNKKLRTKLSYNITRGHDLTEEDLKKEFDCT
jgi:ATP-dependent Clp protease ATP-binding subunit ClpB